MISLTFSTFHISIAQYLCQWCGQRRFLSNHEHTLHLWVRLLSTSFRQIKMKYSIRLWLLLSVCLSILLVGLTHHFVRSTPCCLYHECTKHETKFTCQKCHQMIRSGYVHCKYCFPFERLRVNSTRKKLIKLQVFNWIESIGWEPNKNVRAKFKGYGVENGDGVRLWRWVVRLFVCAVIPRVVMVFSTIDSQTSILLRAVAFRRIMRMVAILMNYWCIIFVLQSAIMRMKCDHEIRSGAENAAIVLCTKNAQRDVSMRAGTHCFQHPFASNWHQPVFFFSSRSDCVRCPLNGMPRPA